MSSNLRHWSVLGKTDIRHTKPFNRGRFKGTATRPAYHEQQLTEHFGPCGIGWGMNKPEFTLVPALEELVVFCTVALWYLDGEDVEGNRARAEVWGVGGDKVLAQQSTGPFINDEAYKSAFTDALGNAMKRIGVGADVHMGLFEDSKYVRDLREEFIGYPEAPQKPADEPSRPPAPNGAAQPSPPQARSAGTEAGQLKLSTIRDRIMAELQTKTTRVAVDAYEKLCAGDLELISNAHGPTAMMLRSLFETQRQSVPSGLAEADALTRLRHGVP